MKKKAEVVTMETTWEICSLVTLISFYTTRTFNHETTRTQLQLNPVGIPLASAPWLQTVLWSRAEPRLLWGPPSSKSNGYSGLLASKVHARWVSEGDCCGAGLATASQDFSRGHPAPGQCSHQCYLFHNPPDPNVTGLRMDLICSVQENAIFPLLLRHGLLSLSPKRKIMEVGVEAIEKEEEGLPWTLLKAGWMFQKYIAATDKQGCALKLMLMHFQRQSTCLPFSCGSGVITLLSPIS